VDEAEVEKRGGCNAIQAIALAPVALRFTPLLQSDKLVGTAWSRANARLAERGLKPETWRSSITTVHRTFPPLMRSSEITLQMNQLMAPPLVDFGVEKIDGAFARTRLMSASSLCQTKVAIRRHLEDRSRCLMRSRNVQRMPSKLVPKDTLWALCLKLVKAL
jgi:hypothetical protein